ncbi:hypothetical protein L0F63_005635 [Massospora cicadina]|nr:hypothetical protein L0F63_005635 [Massospora cicadina]
MGPISKLRRAFAKGCKRHKAIPKERIKLRMVVPEHVNVGNHEAVVAGQLRVEEVGCIDKLTIQIFLMAATYRLKYVTGTKRLLQRDSCSHLFLQQEFAITNPPVSIVLPFAFNLPKDAPSSFQFGNIATRYKVFANLNFNSIEMAIEQSFQVIRQFPS